MWGINKKVIYRKIEDDGFDDPIIVSEIPILARVQKHNLTTREQSNAYEIGQSTTYFTTLNFLDYRKGDQLIYLDEVYTINAINKQPNIDGKGFLYYKLETVYNA